MERHSRGLLSTSWVFFHRRSYRTNMFLYSWIISRRHGPNLRPRDFYYSWGVSATTGVGIWHSNTDSLRPRNEFYLFKGLCPFPWFDKTQILPLHPQSNGILERGLTRSSWIISSIWHQEINRIGTWITPIPACVLQRSPRDYRLCTIKDAFWSLTSFSLWSLIRS